LRKVRQGWPRGCDPVRANGATFLPPRPTNRCSERTGGPHKLAPRPSALSKAGRSRCNPTRARLSAIALTSCWKAVCGSPRRTITKNRPSTCALGGCWVEPGCLYTPGREGLQKVGTGLEPFAIFLPAFGVLERRTALPLPPRRPARAAGRPGGASRLQRLGRGRSATAEHEEAPRAPFSSILVGAAPQTRMKVVSCGGALTACVPLRPEPERRSRSHDLRLCSGGGRPGGQGSGERGEPLTLAAKSSHDETDVRNSRKVGSIRLTARPVGHATGDRRSSDRAIALIVLASIVVPWRCSRRCAGSSGRIGTATDSHRLPICLPGRT
jgi:hypothetical protein